MIIVLFDLAVVIIHIHLHLPQVLMRDLSDLKINEDIALEDRMIEHQINKEMIPVQGDAFLPGQEGEPFAELKKKSGEIFHQRALQFVFIELRRW